MRTERERRSHYVCTSVIYLCTDHSWPETRPMPSIRRRLAPSRCYAGSWPGAAAESLQTEEVQQRKGGEPGKENWVKWQRIYLNKNPKVTVTNCTICFHATTEIENHAPDWGARTPKYKSQITTSQLFSVSETIHRHRKFRSPLKPCRFVTRFKLEANYTPATNLYYSHVGCCNQVKSITLCTTAREVVVKPARTDAVGGAHTLFLPSKFGQ